MFQPYTATRRCPFIAAGIDCIMQHELTAALAKADHTFVNHCALKCIIPQAVHMIYKKSMSLTTSVPALYTRSVLHSTLSTYSSHWACLTISKMQASPCCIAIVNEHMLSALDPSSSADSQDQQQCSHPGQNGLLRSWLAVSALALPYAQQCPARFEIPDVSSDT